MEKNYVKVTEGVSGQKGISGHGPSFRSLVAANNALHSVGEFEGRVCVRTLHECRVRCHGKMGTPQNGDPGSPYSREYGDPGPHFPGKMGTPGPHFPQEYGDPLVKMGTPSMTDG